MAELRAPGALDPMRHAVAMIATRNQAVFEDIRHNLRRFGVARLLHRAPQDMLNAPRDVLWLLDFRLVGARQIAEQMLATGHRHGMGIVNTGDAATASMCVHLGLPTMVCHRPVEPPPREAAQMVLTSREIEILILVAQGRSNPEIAEKLTLSALTVKSHLARMMKRTGALDRANLVLLGLRAGLIA